MIEYDQTASPAPKLSEHPETYRVEVKIRPSRAKLADQRSESFLTSVR